MGSFIWNQDFDEAYFNPYEYAAQEQFVREAKKILSRLSKALAKYNMRFGRDETCVRKAAWMFHNDSIEALQEALALLKKKKHNLVGRIFRDVWESSQMVEYFLSGSLQSQSDLKEWFDNEIISHERIRKHLKRNGRKSEAEERKERQRELSKFTHRTYRAMLKGYSRGGDDKMVYDNYLKLSASTHTISAYYAILGWLILQTSESMKKSKLVPIEQIKRFWKQSFEKTTAPRRFAIQMSIPLVQP